MNAATDVMRVAAMMPGVALHGLAADRPAPRYR